MIYFLMGETELLFPFIKTATHMPQKTIPIFRLKMIGIERFHTVAEKNGARTMESYNCKINATRSASINTFPAHFVRCD